MAETVTFEDPHGIGAPITLERAVIPSDLADAEIGYPAPPCPSRPHGHGEGP
jgi:hypothetical protein